MIRFLALFAQHAPRLRRGPTTTHLNFSLTPPNPKDNPGTTPQKKDVRGNNIPPCPSKDALKAEWPSHIPGGFIFCFPPWRQGHPTTPPRGKYTHPPPAAHTHPGPDPHTHQKDPGHTHNGPDPPWWLGRNLVAGQRSGNVPSLRSFALLRRPHVIVR
jgi:hypothetical protein